MPEQKGRAGDPGEGLFFLASKNLRRFFAPNLFFPYTSAWLTRFKSHTVLDIIR